RLLGRLLGCLCLGLGRLSGCLGFLGSLLGLSRCLGRLRRLSCRSCRQSGFLRCLLRLLGCRQVRRLSRCCGVLRRLLSSFRCCLCRLGLGLGRLGCCLGILGGFLVLRCGSCRFRSRLPGCLSRFLRRLGLLLGLFCRLGGRLRGS